MLGIYRLVYIIAAILIIYFAIGTFLFLYSLNREDEDFEEDTEEEWDELSLEEEISEYPSRDSEEDFKEYKQKDK